MTPEEGWSRYFVFSSTRNPYARAASAYDYLSSKWGKHSGPCAPPPFKDFCRDPTILGRISNIFYCHDNRAGGTEHDFYHVEPVSPCLTTAQGRPAVDFLVRYEHLADDLAEAVRIINMRRDPHLPKIIIKKNISQSWIKMGKAAWQVRSQLMGSNSSRMEGGSPEAHVPSQQQQQVQQVHRVAEVDMQQFLQQAAVRHAHKFRACGKGCVEGLSAYLAGDLQLLQLT